MNARTLLVPALASLALTACAGIHAESREAAPRVGVPALDLSRAAERHAFPSLAGDATLPSADAVAMHMEKVLGDSAAADVRVCVDPSGQVTDATLTRSSGLAAYDAGVLNDVRAWRFEAPAHTACTDLTVAYTLR